MLILHLGDTHFPWAHWPTITAFVERVHATRGVKDVHVVQHGDLFDMYAFSRFPRTHNLMTPAQELKKGRGSAEDMWERIRRANPRAKLWQLRGNHDARPKKRVTEALPELESVVAPAFEALWTFDGVETIHDETEPLKLGEVACIHGFSAFGKHVAYTEMNTWAGHTHFGAIRYFRKGRGLLWEANCGFAGNPMALPLCYGSYKTTAKGTQGWGETEDGFPKFVGRPNP